MTRREPSNFPSVAGSRMVLPFRMIARWAMLISMVFCANLGLAQNNPEVFRNIGVIDMNEVLQKSEAIAKVRAALDEKNEEFQSSIAEEELRLRKEERALSDDEFNQRFAQFELDVVAIQQSIQLQQSRFDRSIQQANATLEQELIKIVSEIAKERQLSMVIQRKNVVIYDSATDMTGEALQRLNERTKNLTVTLQPGGGNG
ncbi:MAG: OmpH family outer membrane protein [Alphaproteobacteria bacterium]|nr:OmpH family outer membrane protein [Alphaproteobacteria bacterium]